MEAEISKLLPSLGRQIFVTKQEEIDNKLYRHVQQTTHSDSACVKGKVMYTCDLSPEAVEGIKGILRMGLVGCLCFIVSLWLMVISLTCSHKAKEN